MRFFWKFVSNAYKIKFGCEVFIIDLWEKRLACVKYFNPFGHDKFWVVLMDAKKWCVQN
jgi:hypothetical protein